MLFGVLATFNIVALVPKLAPVRAQHTSASRRQATLPKTTPVGAQHTAFARRQASLLASLAVGCALLPAVAGADAPPQAPRIAMETTAGRMEFELWPDVAPKTVESFVKLANQGFYNGQCFHRIISGFVIQGGDPNSKVGYGPTNTLEGADAAAVRMWGRGGPGFTVPAEFNSRKHEFGVLSMARSSDPNSAGSQFFVCLGSLTSLDNQYTTFGKLTSGESVLQALGRAETARGDYPKTRQGIISVRVLK